MRFDPFKSFGHPVLRPAETDDARQNADYIGYNFNVEMSPKFKPGSTEIILIEYDTYQPTNVLEDLIKNGKAQFVVTVSCRETFFTHTHKTNKLNSSFEIEANKLHGLTELSAFITSSEPIEIKYDKINEEFGYKCFSVESDAILAQSFTDYFYIHKEFYRDARSIVSLSVSNELKDGDYIVNLDTQTQYIEVTTSESLNKKINGMWHNDDSATMVLNSFYIPIVTNALIKLEEDPETYEEYKWAQVLKSQLSTLSADGPIREEPHNQAQALFRYPLKKISESVA